MGQFDRQVALAQRLIQKFGVVVRWYQLGVPTIPDATKPWLKANAADTFNDVYVVFLDEGDAFLRHMLGDDVPTGGLYGLMGSVNFTPKLTDYIKHESTQYTVVDPLRKLSPNLTQDVLWLAHFTR